MRVKFQGLKLLSDRNTASSCLSESVVVLIGKYGSTFYVGMGQVQNGHLYLRYASSSVITTAKRDKHLQTKSLCYSIVKNAPRVLLVHIKANKTTRNFDFLFLSFFLLCFPSCIIKKLQYFPKPSTYQMNTLALWTCLFWFKAVCKS